MMNKKWDNPDYQRITSVRVKQDDLLVEFQDGSIANLELASVLPPNAHDATWNYMQFNPYEIIVPTTLGETEIPWSTIRLLTDSDFAAYWAQRAEEQAKDIGHRIRELRKGRNLTSKEVAERAGISPQSLSRIEKGHHDVVFTTLRKILAAMGCTLKDLASVKVISPSFSSIFNRLETVGIKKEWLITRILPKDLVSSVDNDEIDQNTLLDEAIHNITKIYRWTPEQILGSEPLILDYSSFNSARFKSSARIQENQASAYALYAHYISLLAIQSTDHTKIQSLHKDPREIRHQITQSYGHLNFANVLRYVWDLGIPVVPLLDSGTFHGACWKMSGRFAIVLKQVTRYQGRWLFDLAHEFGHVTKHLSEDQSSVIEVEEISPFYDSDEEWEASKFASDLLFGRDVENLAELCVDLANNKVENLKSAVIQVAANEHVPVDILANYIAFRLYKTNSINWWGAANNLQITEPSPWIIAKQMLLERIRPELINSEDYNLLLRAIEG